MPAVTRYQGKVMLENMIIRGIVAGFFVFFVDVYRYYSFIGDQYRLEFDNSRRKILLIYAAKFITYPIVGGVSFSYLNNNSLYSFIAITIWILLFYSSYYIIMKENSKNLKN